MSLRLIVCIGLLISNVLFMPSNFMEKDWLMLSINITGMIASLLAIKWSIEE